MKRHDKCPLHKDVIDFWSNNGKEISSRLLNSKGGDIVIYFHGSHDGSGYPPLDNIIAFEYNDGRITYRLNNKNLKEEQILRLIKLKSFL